VKSIKDLRLERNITPPQMASLLKIALSTYFDKEAGRRKFQPAEIVQLCKMFSTRVEDVKDFYQKDALKIEA